MARFTKPYRVDWQKDAAEHDESTKITPGIAPGGRSNTLTGQAEAPGRATQRFTQRGLPAAAREYTLAEDPAHSGEPVYSPAHAAGSASESASITSRRIMDSSKTMIDQPVPTEDARSARHARKRAEARVATAEPAVDAANESGRGSSGAGSGAGTRGASGVGGIESKNPMEQRAMVARGQAESVVVRDPPTIVLAQHEFTLDHAQDERLVILREPDSERAAAFRVLRHQIVRQGNPQIIVVTSARPDEGKTTVAVNLASALGESGRSRTLLIEANFTKPCLSAVFRFKPPWCFAQQVAEHRSRGDERWSVVELVPSGLHVAAVDLRTEQRPLLDAPAFSFAVDQLSNGGYDYIVIDGPSVLGSAEVNLLQDSADGVLLVTRSGKSRRKDLRRAIEQLAPETILGVTLLQE